MADSPEVVRRRFGSGVVEAGLRPGETPADVEGDLRASEAFFDDLRSQGTESWRSRYRWWGPVKWLAYKEVGPPPWRFPRAAVQPRLRPFTVRFIAGWRSTAYAFVVMWAGRHPAQSDDDD